MSEIGEDFCHDLENDLGPFDDDEDDKSNENPILQLRSYIEHYEPAALFNYKELDIEDVTCFPKFEPRINELISRCDDKELTKMLSILNSLAYIAQSEIIVLHNLGKLLYREKFEELEILVSRPQQFADVIRIIETNEGNLWTDAQLTKEQVLILNMSMKSSFKAYVNVDKNKVLKVCDSLLAVSKILTKINSFILSKATFIAPNLCSLVGPDITSLLLSYSGGVLELSQIPSCNLASIGKNRHGLYELHTKNLVGVRQEGYIYNSSLVQDQPWESRKHALRMLCAKVALAARVDAGHPKDNQLGYRWHNEILEKLRKLREPPPSSLRVKPLPVPEDQPRKKRAGRKFKKYKERFQLSHLRKLQNRMEFGKPEQSIVANGTGEEIGLGMANSLQNIPVAEGNNAKMSRVMRQRMVNANRQEAGDLL